MVCILLIHKKRKRYQGIVNAALNTSVFSFSSNSIFINLDERKTLVVVIRTFVNGFCDRLIQYLAMIITTTLVVVSTYPKHNF